MQRFGDAANSARAMCPLHVLSQSLTVPSRVQRFSNCTRATRHAVHWRHC